MPNNIKIFIACCLLSTTIYGVEHISSSQYVYEDSTYVSGQFTVKGEPQWDKKGLVKISELFTNFPNTHFVSLTFQYTPAGPVVAHTINFAIHLLNCLMIALIFNYFLGSGWIIGSLFTLSPITSQAISYAAARTELMSLFIVLLFIWFAIVSNQRTVIRWAGLLLTIYLALVTKPTLIAVIGPLAFWCYINDLIQCRYTYYETGLLKGLKAESMLPFIGVVLYFVYRIMHNVNSSVPLIRWIGVQSYAMWMLFFKSLVPMQLAINHAWWLASNSVQIVSAIGVLLVFLFLLIAIQSGISDAFILGLGWFWISLLPRLFARDTMGWIREHHVYIASVGVSIIIGHLLTSHVKRSFTNCN